MIVLCHLKGLEISMVINKDKISNGKKLCYLKYVCSPQAIHGVQNWRKYGLVSKVKKQCFGIDVSLRFWEAQNFKVK